MDIQTDIRFKPIPHIDNGPEVLDDIKAAPDDPLARLERLAPLSGVWTGIGFNTIWRPFHQATPTDDDNNQFLEINATTETIKFDPITGSIPNRGLLQPDMKMYGLTYMQQISDSIHTEDGHPAGLHVEPGIWATVPSTADPSVPRTVVRMASIPHGTTILAQGEAGAVPAAHLADHSFIPDTDIFPFPLGKPHEKKTDFEEQTLGNDNPRRFPKDANAPIITQAHVNNPNLVLQEALQGQTVKKATFLNVTTRTENPLFGGGTSNTAFLVGGHRTTTGTGGPNAKAFEVSATFWIETIEGTGGAEDFLQLQYTQKVILDFDNRSWPHITVATLTKVPNSTVLPLDAAEGAVAVD
jgi:hypothetical protein